MSLSEQFAELIVSTDYDALPQKVRDAVGQDVVDVVGCAIWGLNTPWGQRIVDHVSDYEPGSVAVWGTEVTTGTEKAALALGTLAHAIDFDDYHPAAKVHPAAIVLPAAISLGHTIGATGRETLAAAAMGFEVMIRVSLGTGSVAGMLNGYHMTGITGALGAAAAAAKLHRLNAAETTNALGLAATQAAGLMGFVHEGSDTKRLHAGRAAETGLVSAELARSGMTAPRHMLEMPHGGFMHAFSTEANPDRALQGLGERWHAGDVSVKAFSCCGSIHASLEAVENVMRDQSLQTDDITQVTVFQSQAVVTQCGWPYVPSDAMHAQMSLRYCLAVSLLDGEVLPHQFAEERLADSEVIALAQRIDVLQDDEMDALYPETFASRVLVQARRRTWEGRCARPRGSADNPMSDAQVHDKFRALSVDRLGDERTVAFLRAAKNLAAAESLDELLDPLSMERSLDEQGWAKTMNMITMESL